MTQKKNKTKKKTKNKTKTKREKRVTRWEEDPLQFTMD
jgi:hypothetical protein